MTRLLAPLLAFAACAFAADPAPAPPPAPLDFIDTSFENASPLWYEFAPDGTVIVNLNYDQERLSPNRAAGHFHFRIQAAKGRRVTLELRNLANVWNSKAGFGSLETATVFSEAEASNTDLPIASDQPEWLALPAPLA